MRKLSIKSRVTLWYMVLMVILVALVLFFMFLISEKVIETSAKDDLKNQVIKSADEIEYDDGELDIDDDLDYYSHDIYIMIYHEDGSLIDGRMPDGFDPAVSLENETMKTVNIEGEQYYLYDTRVTFDKHDDIWVRGITAVSESASIMNTMINIALIVLPVLMILGTLGGYWITKKAFRPVEQIREAANRISEGSDLSQRINLSEGKDEIYALAATFDRMLDRLQYSFEAEKQFTADASHELRTPVTVIISQCEFALEHSQRGPEARAAFELILRQSHRMASLVSQLLTLSKTDRGFVKLQPEVFDLSELLEIIADEQLGSAQEKNVSIRTKIEPKIMVNADQAMITRLVINLITNAIKYGNENGYIEVELEQSKNNAIISVRDNGIGISTEHLPKIWNRFYRVDSSRTDGKSAGLGLSIVKWIADAHNGNVSVESTPGDGSTFIFTLPLNL
jgi:heavy metal sensor kinase